MQRELLDTLWQLQQNPNFEGTDILLTSELSADEGQALQLQLLERWLNEGETLGGWKIGMTSGESRDALGPGIRPFGFVLKSRLVNKPFALCFCFPVLFFLLSLSPSFPFNERKVREGAIGGVGFLLPPSLLPFPFKERKEEREGCGA